MIGGHSRAREVGLDAPPSPAIAVRPFPLIGGGPRKGIVTPLAPDGVWPGDDATVDGQPTTGTGTDDDGEDGAFPGACPVGGFRQRQAVGVVGDANLPIQGLR